MAAIDEASRFRRGHEVQPYQGLIPRELSSGETQVAVNAAIHSSE